MSFNIKQAITLTHSKATNLAVQQYVGNDKKRFKELMDLVLSDEVLMVQRASWAMGIIAENYPTLLLPYWDKLFKRMENPLHVSYHRNVFRALHVANHLPVQHHGFIVDLCFNTIINLKQPTASRVFAMYVVSKLAKFYPDLKNEIILSVEPILQEELPSLKGAAKTVLKQMQKIN